jgi:hypothetical protein
MAQDKMDLTQLRHIIREELKSQLNFPKGIGFRGETDFEGGFKKEFAKFFDKPEGTDQPAGIFMELANLVVSRFDLQSLIDSIGSIAEDIYDYLYPSIGHLSPYDIKKTLQIGAPQAMWEDMMSVNKMGKVLIQNLNNPDFKDEEKIGKVLDGIISKLEIIREIFTTNFEEPTKSAPIGFKKY